MPIGFLLDTDVVAAPANRNGAPSVKSWAAKGDEACLHISALTLAEYDQGIYGLPDNHADRTRHEAARDALEARFGNRVIEVDRSVVRRWAGFRAPYANGPGTRLP